MHRIIVLSGERYFRILDAALGLAPNVFNNSSHIDSICIVKNKYGYISHSFFHYDIKRNIITDIRKQLTDKEIDRLLILMDIMGTKEAFDTLF